MEVPFRIDFRAGERATVLAVVGELDVFSAPRLDAQLAVALGSDAPQVILDLRGVEFMDSSGLRSVVLANRRAKRGHRSLTIVDGPAQVHMVLSRTGVLASLTVVAPEDLPV